MFERLRLALRALRGRIESVGAEPCHTCALQTEIALRLTTENARLEEQVAYWRRREERTADRLLEVHHGVSGVATPLAPAAPSIAHTVMAAMNVREVPPDRTTDDTSAAGPDARRRGAAH